MPLIKNASLENCGRIGVWEISEPTDFFRSGLALHPREKEEYSRINFDHKSLEWLASRYLTQHLHNKAERDPITKDDQGKPFFTESSQFLSLSHTDGFVASCFHDRPCGIDIQVYDKKTLKVAPRILSKEEMQRYLSKPDLSLATFYWSAKEAVYKAYGKRKLEFRTEIILRSFTQSDHQMRGEIALIKDHLHLNYLVEGYFDERFVLVTAIEINA
jgi:4'-phosphopantetheinyl transferase